MTTDNLFYYRAVQSSRDYSNLDYSINSTRVFLNYYYYYIIFLVNIIISIITPLDFVMSVNELVISDRLGIWKRIFLPSTLNYRDSTRIIPLCFYVHRFITRRKTIWRRFNTIKWRGIVFFFFFCLTRIELKLKTEYKNE